jgi:hypothetical protein
VGSLLNSESRFWACSQTQVQDLPVYILPSAQDISNQSSNKKVPKHDNSSELLAVATTRETGVLAFMELVK